MPLRAQVGSALEWLGAAALFVAVVAIVSSLSRMPRSDAGPEPPPAVAVVTAVSRPAAVPAGAVSMPVLVLSAGEVRLGMTCAAVAEMLGRRAESGRQAVEPGIRGERLVRFYEHGAARFALVFDQAAGEADLGVTAIYLLEGR